MEEAMAIKRARVNVSGRVQGVYYRANTIETARKLGLSGWVKNNMDGSVEAVFQGDELQVDKAIAWCHKGPPSAFVSDVTVKDETPVDEKSGFNVRY